MKVNRDTAVPLIGTWQFPPIVAGGADLRIEDAGHLSGLHYFPFTAIVEQERLKQALLLNAVNPAVGGVLIKGPSGHREVDGGPRARRASPRDRRRRRLPVLVRPGRRLRRAESCRARSELPVVRRRRRIVDLPLNATEDRVSGSVDVARALKDGEQALEPGLLAEANRGILYVDEINLLDDHLTDVLLDAAALGVNVVEREGVSVSHPARFLLVGTMNEEEGELRPQIADRIGLEVEVEALDDPAARAEVDPPARGVRRRPGGVPRRVGGRTGGARRGDRRRGGAAGDGARSGRALRRGRASVVVGSGVESHRADIAIVECAKAIAALDGRDEVGADDVLAAAALALGHRLDADPFAPPPRSNRRSSGGCSTTRSRSR